MPKLDGILGIAIHTEDMVRSRAFYEGTAQVGADLSAYAVGGRDVLLVFRKGATMQAVTLPSGTIPGHGGDGALHVAFCHRQGRARSLGGASRFERSRDRRTK